MVASLQVRRYVLVAFSVLLIGGIIIVMDLLSTLKSHATPVIPGLVRGAINAYREEHGHDPGNFMEAAPYLELFFKNKDSRVTQISSDEYLVLVRVGDHIYRVWVKYRIDNRGEREVCDARFANDR